MYFNLSEIECQLIIQGDQQENKLRVLLHFLLYRNVFLSLIVNIQCGNKVTINSVIPLIFIFWKKNLKGV
jgi:hypothetical protein